jgi:hypothetical protein
MIRSQIGSGTFSLGLNFFWWVALAVVLGGPGLAIGDGVIIDKVYAPYVELLEREIEYRTLYENDDQPAIDGRQRHILGVGRTLSDKIYAEIYLTGVGDIPAGLSVDDIELELIWQLSEQGEFNNDWGLLFELERDKNDNEWEASTTLIGLRNWRRWTMTGNVTLAYEWGSQIEDELDTSVLAQFRHRSVEWFEPAFEIYLGEDTTGAGPVLTGLYRLSNRNKIRWEFGVIFGADSTTADTNWKFNLEYEF